MKCLLQLWYPHDFIKNLYLSTLRVVCAHEGGSGGVIELLDANGQRYMLKFSDSGILNYLLIIFEIKHFVSSKIDGHAGNSLTKTPNVACQC